MATWRFHSLTLRAAARVLGVLSLAVAVLGPASGAVADSGNLRINCRPNTDQRARVDPLEHYATFPSPHEHTPAGARAFSAKSTVAQMLAAPTSCEVAQDHSMLWFPTPMTRSGRPARVLSIDYYLTNQGYYIRRAPPDGLRFVSGSPDCKGDFCPAIYLCTTTAGKALSLHTIPTARDHCSVKSGTGYTMIVYSPGQCWTGRSLGQGMGGHGPAATITAARRCHGQVIPRVEGVMEVGENGVGGFLASDVMAGTTKSSPGSTGHFDFAFGWKRDSSGNPLGAVVRLCLDRRGVRGSQGTCAAVPNTTGSAAIYELDPRTDGLRAGPPVVPSVRTRSAARR